MKYHSLLLLIASITSLCSCSAAAGTIRGKVSADGKPLAGCLVSDGVNIVETDSKGRYSIESDKADSTVFVITPSGYKAVAPDGIRPAFWALLTKPAGKSEKHDFKLVKENQDKYSVVFITDFHLVNEEEIQDLDRCRNEVLPAFENTVEKCRADGPVYCINMGDFAMDKYFYENEFNLFDAFDWLKANGWNTEIYSVCGNHDNDPGIQMGSEDAGYADNDRICVWQYRHLFGPDRYSVNIGNDHWVFLDDVVYKNTLPARKEEGVKGYRDYDKRFTDEQIEWLKKDLSYVGDGQNVKIVCHVPPFTPQRKNSIYFTTKQLNALDSLCGRWDRVEIYSGHVHKNSNCSSPLYPRFVQYNLSATSGAIWKANKIEYPLLGLDGSDASAIHATFGEGLDHRLQYDSYYHGRKHYRIYDMNTITKDWGYTPRKVSNEIWVNYWAWIPGDTVTIFEGGKQLEVRREIGEDPLCHFTCVHSEAYSTNLFKATARKSNTPVTVVISDASGKELFRETVQRPKASTWDME